MIIGSASVKLPELVTVIVPELPFFDPRVRFTTPLAGRVNFAFESSSR